MQRVVRSSAVASSETRSINNNSSSSSSEHGDDSSCGSGSGNGNDNDNGSISLVTRIQEWMSFQSRRQKGNHQRKAFCDRCWCTLASMIEATRTGSCRRNLVVVTVLFFLLSNFAILPLHKEIYETRIKIPRGRIFICGWPYPMAEYMFPEYEYMGTWALSESEDSNIENKNEHNSNDNDILVVGLWGPACNNDKGDEQTAFSGKILYVNGEPDGDPVSNSVNDRTYQIGPYPRRQNITITDNKNKYEIDFYNNHSLKVFFISMILLHDFYIPSIWTEEPEDQIAAAEAWNQLVQGNGYGGNGYNSEQETETKRIPAVVYVARNCIPFRQEAAELLAQTFETPTMPFVHYGGACTVPGGISVPKRAHGEWENEHRDQLHSNWKTIYTRYKYCLVMENTKQEGYATEKLLYGLLGGCLPIYYGSKDVYGIFRNDSFVYWDINDPEPALAEIRRLEQDPAEYRRRTSRERPLLKQQASGMEGTLETLDRYFSLFPEIGNGRLCRELHKMMGLPLPASLLSP